jgi:hypothetical protein
MSLGLLKSQPQKQNGGRFGVGWAKYAKMMFKIDAWRNWRKYEKIQPFRIQTCLRCQWPAAEATSAAVSIRFSDRCE